MKISAFSDGTFKYQPNKMEMTPLTIFSQHPYILYHFNFALCFCYVHRKVVEGNEGGSAEFVVHVDLHIDVDMHGE